MLINVHKHRQSEDALVGVPSYSNCILKLKNVSMIILLLKTISTLYMRSALLKNIGLIFKILFQDHDKK